MKVIIAIIVGCIGGFIVGIALSSLIGILGLILFNEPLSIKFLPYLTALIGAIILPFIYRKQTPLP